MAAFATRRAAPPNVARRVGAGDMPAPRLGRAGNERGGASYRAPSTRAYLRLNVRQ